MKVINKTDTKIIRTIHARDSYPKAIRRSLVVGLIAGIFIGSYYGLVVKRYEDDAVQSGISLGVVYGLTLAGLMCAVSLLQIFVARRALKKKNTHR